jgi:hypothetical protein
MRANIAEEASTRMKEAVYVLKTVLFATRLSATLFTDWKAIPFSPITIAPVSNAPQSVDVKARGVWKRNK